MIGHHVPVWKPQTSFTLMPPVNRRIRSWMDFVHLCAELVLMLTDWLLSRASVSCNDVLHWVHDRALDPRLAVMGIQQHNNN